MSINDYLDIINYYMQAAAIFDVDEAVSIPEEAAEAEEKTGDWTYGNYSTSNMYYNNNIFDYSIINGGDYLNRLQSSVYNYKTAVDYFSNEVEEKGVIIRSIGDSFGGKMEIYSKQALFNEGNNLSRVEKFYSSAISDLALIANGYYNSEGNSQNKYNQISSNLADTENNINILYDYYGEYIASDSCTANSNIYSYLNKQNSFMELESKYDTLKNYSGSVSNGFKYFEGSYIPSEGYNSGRYGMASSVYEDNVDKNVDMCNALHISTAFDDSYHNNEEALHISQNKLSELIKNVSVNNSKTAGDVNINVDFTANAQLKNNYDVKQFANVFVKQLEQELASCAEGIHY